MLGVVLDFFTLARFGLLFNLAGTIMVAMSFGKNLGDAYQTNKKGQRVYLASFLYPKLFHWGLITLAVGFLVQFFA